jgi:ribosome recycling factor
MTQDTIKSARERMKKALAHTTDQMRGIRTSRASSTLVDNIRVDYYGTPTPLSQVAQVSVPEPRTLVIKPFDMSAIKDIEKALQKSDLGISPSNDGKVIILNLPPLSGDQRNKYVAKAKEICEEGRITLRNLRRDANKDTDNQLKAKDITEDVCHDLHDDVQSLLKEYEKLLSDVFDKKSKEILEV